jgi:hypothetical protein
MLARGACPVNTLVPAARALRSRESISVYHVITRQHSRMSAAQQAITLKIKTKRLEAQILQLNANPDLSAQEKYRTSVRLFAVLDQGKQMAEVGELRATLLPALNKACKILVKDNPKAPDPTLAHAADQAELMTAACRKLAGLQWKVFRLTVFAPGSDIVWADRLAMLSSLAKQIATCALMRMFCYGGVVSLWKWKVR